MVLDVSSNGLGGMLVPLYLPKCMEIYKRKNEFTHMNMQWPEILSKVFLLVWAYIFEVLVAENDHSPLSNEQGKLVLLSVVQLRKLKASDFSTDNWSEFRNFQL